MAYLLTKGKHEGDKMKTIEKGIIGEGMVGKNIRSFISVVGKHTYFGFREVMTGEIIEFQKVRDLKKAIGKVIGHAKQFSL